MPHPVYTLGATTTTSHNRRRSDYTAIQQQQQQLQQNPTTHSSSVSDLLTISPSASPLVSTHTFDPISSSLSILNNTAKAISPTSSSSMTSTSNNHNNNMISSTSTSNSPPNTNGGNGPNGEMLSLTSANHDSSGTLLSTSSSSNNNNNKDISSSNMNNNTSEFNFDDTVENKVRNSVDKNCWSTFVITSWTALACFVVLIWSQWHQSAGEVQMHSMEYFVLCMIGGVLSGLPHFILTPFDQIKCRMQTGEFATAVDGFKVVWNDPLHRGSFALRVIALYRGWVPTLIGYSLQGATKFGLYEYLKWYLKASFGAEFAKEHQVVLFLLSSAFAEFCADVLLAPWEAIKVKMQTNAALLNGGGALTSQVVPRIYSLEGLQGFFKGLPPLWMRQVPYTMTKFATFEKTVEFFYLYILRATKKETSPAVQLLVSLMSGFVAGFFCTVVSHPADTVVSKLNQKHDARVGAWQVMQELGCIGLWKGLVARIMFVGTLTGMQWLIYDSFKILVGLQTTGGGASVASASAPQALAHSDHLGGGGVHHGVRHMQHQMQNNN